MKEEQLNAVLCFDGTNEEIHSHFQSGCCPQSISKMKKEIGIKIVDPTDFGQYAQ